MPAYTVLGYLIVLTERSGDPDHAQESLRQAHSLTATAHMALLRQSCTWLARHAATAALDVASRASFSSAAFSASLAADSVASAAVLAACAASTLHEPNLCRVSTGNGTLWLHVAHKSEKIALDDTVTQH